MQTFRCTYTSMCFLKHELKYYKHERKYFTVSHNFIISPIESEQVQYKSLNKKPYTYFFTDDLITFALSALIPDTLFSLFAFQVFMIYALKRTLCKNFENTYQLMSQCQLHLNIFWQRSMFHDLFFTKRSHIFFFYLGQLRY